MKRTKSMLDRQYEKTFSAWLLGEFQHRYSLSLAASESLVQFLLSVISKIISNSLLDGQQWYQAISKEEPAGKPLSACKKVRVKLTLLTDEDLKIRGSQGLHALHSVQVYRLTEEAFEQGALLTIEDLAILMNLSVSTIKRIIAAYRAQGIDILTRGAYKDIGPGISHKARIVQLFLQGYTESEIATRTNHSLKSIERCLIDFIRVFTLLEQGFSPDQTRVATRLSPKIIRDYTQLYESYSKRSDCQDRLEELRQYYHLNLKKNNN